MPASLEPMLRDDSATRFTTVNGRYPFGFALVALGLLFFILQLVAAFRGQGWSHDFLGISLGLFFAGAPFVMISIRRTTVDPVAGELSTRLSLLPGTSQLLVFDECTKLSARRTSFSGRSSNDGFTVFVTDRENREFAIAFYSSRKERSDRADALVVALENIIRNGRSLRRNDR